MSEERRIYAAMNIGRRLECQCNSLGVHNYEYGFQVLENNFSSYAQ